MRKKKTENQPVTKQVRCAIYTRKSTEERLDMEYNSLEAQRDAALAYIKSQQHEGWYATDDNYDDGGFTGSNIDRPALQQLLRDVKNHKIDCIVVYKIDRLTRSLADFTKLVEILDEHQVTFVSVTQQFSTTSAMGKLTLNILLSFAEFEREMAGERIRDKIAASKRKGMWMGGTPPLGYDVKDRKIHINPKEAKLVRYIFKEYIKTGSVTDLITSLNSKGYRTKTWISQTGKKRGGQTFKKSMIYRFLNNRHYLGEIVHKDECYPGDHEAIIDEKTFNKAQSILENQLIKIGSQARLQTTALLKGLVFTPNNYTMTPSHTRKKNGKLYRYYVSTQAIKSGYASCPIGQIPAGEIEEIILNQIYQLFRTPEMVSETLHRNHETQSALKESDIIDALKKVDPIWEQLFPYEKARIIQLLIAKIIVNPEHVEIHIRFNGIRSLVDELNSQNTEIDTNQQHFIVSLPVKFRRRDGRRRIIVPDNPPETEKTVQPQQPKPESGLVRTLIRAHKWQRWILSKKYESYADIARKEGLTRAYVSRVCKLTLLSPEIQEAILNDELDKDIHVKYFYDLPLLWEEQKQQINQLV